MLESSLFANIPLHVGSESKTCCSLSMTSAVRSMSSFELSPEAKVGQIPPTILLQTCAQIGSLVIKQRTDYFIFFCRGSLLKCVSCLQRHDSPSFGNRSYDVRCSGDHRNRNTNNCCAQRIFKTLVAGIHIHKRHCK